MAYGDSYSAVQSASLAEKQRSDNIVNTLIGVLQNRKQLQQQDQQFQQQHALALMQANKVQDELDWRKNLAEKELQAKASVLDFEKAKQAASERNLAQNFQLNQRNMDLNEEQLYQNQDRNDEDRAVRQQDANVRRSKEQRAEDLITKQDTETYLQANAYAQLMNKKEAAQKVLDSGDGKHKFWWDSKARDTAEKLAKDLDQKLLRVDPKISQLVVPDEKTGEWKPIIAEPQAMRSQSGNVDSESSSVSAGFNPLLRGSAPSVSTPAQPQANPALARIKQLMSMGVSQQQAYQQTASELNDSQNPDSYSRF